MVSHWRKKSIDINIVLEETIFWNHLDHFLISFVEQVTQICMNNLLLDRSFPSLMGLYMYRLGYVN